MDVVRAFFATLLKMFVADLWLTLGAIAMVAVCAILLRLGWIGAAALPFLLSLGVLGALAAAVLRGAAVRKRREG